MSYLRVTNWDQHQHYKNRKPPWIKFYVALLDPQHPINKLPIPTRYLFDRMLLLAAEWDNSIPNSPELIAKLCGMQARACHESLEQLKKGRWIKETSTKRRASKKASSDAPPELEKELEKETPLPPFRKANGLIDATEAFRRWLESPAWDQDFTRDLIRDEVDRINKSRKTTGKLDEFTALRMWQEARQARKYEEAV